MKRRLIVALVLAIGFGSSVSFAATTPTLSLSTDLARYAPASNVEIKASLTGLTGTVKAKYVIYHLNTQVKTGTLNIVSGTGSINWLTPNQDYQGYLTEVTLQTNNKVRAVIGIDVSSDWSKFPRYGFLSDFAVTDSNQMASTITNLNRFHINGIQFYDWQDSHSQPLPLIETVPAASWLDINHRTTYFETVKNYISLAHSKNMLAMNYNLAYGAYSSDITDLAESALYTDANHQHLTTFPLPGWESDLYLLNPANSIWQNYIISKEQAVQAHLSFDGWHVDQLGSANYYDYAGNRVDLAAGYSNFLSAAKDRLGYHIIMNAVDGYGQRQMMASHSLDFNYTEVWNNSRNYGDLATLLDGNWANSKNLAGVNQPTVLAAYMNYNKANQKGSFNTPGVLLTNATIFALGGSHLELGEHMLGKEYFPNNNLKMSSSLRTQLQNYYDFAVAYENLLRDNYQPSAALTSIAKTEVSLDTMAMPDSVWVFARKLSNQKVIHFVNLLGTENTLWRDTDGTQKQPKELRNFKVTITSAKKVKSVFLASPDQSLLASRLEFKQSGTKVFVTIPDLKYWDMLVLNY